MPSGKSFLIIASLSLLFFPALSFATIPPGQPYTSLWSDPDENSLNYKEIRREPLRDLAPYLGQFERTTLFLSRMQEQDRNSPNFGGLHEGEGNDLWAIVETDNTQESIRVWCEYALYFNDPDRFSNQVEAAWVYCERFPAWEESAPGEMYGLHNSGWGLVAEMAYRQAYDDERRDYGVNCAEHLMEHTPEITVNMEDRLMPLVAGWAAGTLYNYGVFEENDEYKDSAVRIARQVKNWIDADLDRLNRNEIWALCGGTAMWGVLNALGAADSAATVAWARQRLPRMDIFAGRGQWNNSWNIWYAHAWYAAYRLTQEEEYVENVIAIVDSLVAQDADGDGGIPATIGDNDNLDQSWVSAYTAWMGLRNLFDRQPQVDVALLSLLSPTLNRPYATNEPMNLVFLAVNEGLSPQVELGLHLRGSVRRDTAVSIQGLQPVEIRWSTPLAFDRPGARGVTAFVDAEDDGNDANDSLHLTFNIRGRGNLVISTINDMEDFVACRLLLQHNDIPDLPVYAELRTDSLSGEASASLMEGVYTITAVPSFPYAPRVIEEVPIIEARATPLALRFSHPPLLLVNRDTDTTRSVYYESALSGRLEFYLWNGAAEGDVGERFDGFHTVVYFTGNREAETIPAADRDAMEAYVNSGGRLFITGQNIADEFAGSRFLEEALHSRHLTNAVRTRLAYGVEGDPVFDGLEMLLLGNRGANNQTSPAGVAAVNRGLTAAVYQNRPDTAAAVRWETDGGGRGVFCAFGFEGVSGQAGVQREELMMRILNWLQTPLEVTDGFNKSAVPGILSLTAWPNPSNSSVRFAFPASLAFDAKLLLWDLTGKNVATLPITRGAVFWDGRNTMGGLVPAGVYWATVQSASGGANFAATRVIILK